MSLVSASSFVGGIKEYLYRGFQQLPLVLVMTSFLFTVTTGSVAHTTMFTGLIFVMPAFTFICQTLFNITGTNNWRRTKADSCNIITDYKSLKDFSYYVNTDINHWNNIPSFWLTSVCFFFGYILANAYDTLVEPGDANKPMNYEKRITTGTFVTFCTAFIFIIILIVRFNLMSSCEGTTTLALVVSGFFGAASIAIGVGLYKLSIQCGARTSDMLGILSQIIPASAASPTPSVCLAQN